MSCSNVIRLAASFVAAVAMMVCSSVASAQAKFQFDLPAQPLADALRAVARVTGVNVLFEPQAVRGKTAHPLSGQFTVEEAVSQVLRDTPLEGKRASADTLVIKSRDEKKGSVSGDASRSATLIAQAPSDRSRDASQDQTTSPDQRAVRGEGIVVTARKRDERLIDVPISIAVVTKDDIDRRGLVNSEDYLRGIPGVSQMDSLYGQSVVIRGIESSPRDQNFGSGPSTATYFGETPTTSTGGMAGGTSIDIKLVDIERVEALRGPQGTAFGNSSMGGAVRTIPVAPKLDRFEGKVGAGYSVTSDSGGDNYNAQAIVNIPLIKDMLAIRVVGYGYQDSGFYRNRAGSDPAFQAAVVTRYGVPQEFAIDEERVGSYYVKGGRVAALFQPNDDLRFTLTFLSQKTETDGSPLALSGIYEQTIMQVAPDLRVRGQKGHVFDTDIDLANAVMEYNLGWANLLATYSHTKSAAIAVQPFGALNLPLTYSGDGHHREHVGEIRLVTHLTGAWNFIAGLYGEEIKDDTDFDYMWFGDPATNVFRSGQLFVGKSLDRRSIKQKAVFGEATWEFMPAFALTGGFRAYNYERSVKEDRSGPLFVTSGNLLLSDQVEASGSTFRSNLSYKLNDRSLLYAGWSQGFRLGRPQPPLPAGLCDRNGDGIVDETNISLASTGIVKSDDVNSYEIGGKFAALDRRLTIDAAIFRMEWSDIPVRVNAGIAGVQGCGLTYVTNAGAARSEGVEFQANFQVTKAVRVDFGASWIHARLTEDVPAQGFRSGNRLPGVPKVNANLGLQYDFSIGGYKASLRGDSIYVGDFYGDLLESRTTKTDAYVKLDASARVAIGKVNLDLFVHNLTNQDAVTFRGAIPRGPFYGHHLRPRTVGFQVGYTF